MYDTLNKQQEKQFETIRKQVEAGQRVLVEFTKLSWDDGYLDKGMRAYITNIGETDIYDMEDGGTDNITALTFDFIEFKDFNQKLEQVHTYNDGTSGTATEMGDFPANSFENVFCSEKYEPFPFRIVNNNGSVLHKRYIHTKSKLPYIEWLELQVIKNRS